MDQNVNHLTRHFQRNKVLDLDSIQEIIKAINCKIPLEYLEFMKETNGGEGIIGEGKYVRFWAFEELLPANNDYNISEFAPDLFMIGSDGGGNGFGFRKYDGVFIEVSFIEISTENAEERGKDFVSFLSFLSES